MSKEPLETRIIGNVKDHIRLVGMQFHISGYCQEFRKKGTFFQHYQGVLKLEAGEEIDIEQKWFIWDEINDVCQAQKNSLIMKGAEGKKSKVTIKGMMKRKGWINKRDVFEVIEVSYEGNVHDLGEDILKEIRKCQKEKEYFEKYFPRK